MNANHDPRPNHDQPPTPDALPARDELDTLLRDWHERNADAAAAGRDRLMAALAHERQPAAPTPSSSSSSSFSFRAVLASLQGPRLRFAAVLALLAGVAALLVMPERSAMADDVIMVPDGGRLEARAKDGAVIGPCPLQHTDVVADIAGRFARVTVTQTFQNAYDIPIEAVYTFPLSHRGAVDRMTMTIGDRVVIGDVKEREQARRIYDAAIRSGQIASLLEQERPNIFTQTVGNIPPGETIDIEISYVETVTSVDGVFQFDFPMTVAPRYIPGRPVNSPSLTPAELTPRRGVILRGPATIEIHDVDTPDEHGAKADDDRLSLGRLRVLLDGAVSIAPPGATWFGVDRDTNQPIQPEIRAAFVVSYANGAKEAGVLYPDGVGRIAQRWFYTDMRRAIRDAGAPGAGYEQNTDQVPDARRISPMPTPPGVRAGHDISVTVNLATGGPGIVDVASELHEINRIREAGRRNDDERPTAASFELARKTEIPNRDFRFQWTQTADTIEEAVFAHGDGDEGFVTVMIDPPARVAEDLIVSRELIFVLDCSGSMEGFPIEQAKNVLRDALGTMREGDTFNIVTFNNSLGVLWNEPKPNTPENRAEARAYVDARQGGGGTEMKPAVLRALERAAADDAEEDDRPIRIVMFLSDGEVGNDMEIIQAARDARDHTRVFTIGIGDSPNRYLLDELARAGAGAADFCSLSSDPAEIVARFVKRIASPVLTNIAITLDGVGVESFELTPDPVPDLHDEDPIIVHARYRLTDGADAVNAKLRVRGRTGRGGYDKTIAVNLPRESDQNDQLPSLWARAQVEDLLRPHLEAVQQGNAPDDIKSKVVALGEQYQLVTPFTSFVAVEKVRTVIGGERMLVAVPIEMPRGQSWEGVFGQRRQRLQEQAGRMELDANLLGRTDDAFGADIVDQLGQVLADSPTHPTAKVLRDAAQVDLKYRGLFEQTKGLPAEENEQLRRLQEAQYGVEGLAFGRTPTAGGTALQTETRASQLRYWFESAPDTDTISLGVPLSTMTGSGVELWSFHMHTAPAETAPIMLGETPVVGEAFVGYIAKDAVLRAHAGVVALDVVAADRLAALPDLTVAPPPASAAPPTARPSAAPPPAPPAKGKSANAQPGPVRQSAAGAAGRHAGAPAARSRGLGGGGGGGDAKADPAQDAGAAAERGEADVQNASSEESPGGMRGRRRAGAPAGDGGQATPALEAAAAREVIDAEVADAAPTEADEAPAPPDPARIEEAARATARAASNLQVVQSAASLVRLDLPAADSALRLAMQFAPEHPPVVVLRELRTELAALWQREGERGFIAAGGHRTAERLVIAAAQAYADGERDAAERLLEGVVLADPAYMPAARGLEALRDAAITDAAEANVLRAAADVARRDLQTAIDDLRVAQVLDRELRDRTGRVRVTVLIDETRRRAVVRTLRDRRLVVLATPPQSPIVIGEASVDALRGLALVDGVRRIAPLRE